MKRTVPATVLLAVLCATGSACADDENLTADQRDAYRQVVAYRTNPEAVVTRSAEYQEAAAQQYVRNLRTLEGAELGEDDALSTLGTCTLEVTDGSTPGPDPAACDAALEAVRAAVEGRLG